MKRRQEELVLDHIRDVGWITSAAAREVYGMQDLPKRISVLRQEGHRISRTLSGSGRERMAVYRLEFC